MSTPKFYSTLDNGASPFQITIIPVVNTREYSVHVKGTEYEGTFLATHLFVGESPRNFMTEFSGGHGSRFDGNSIVIMLQSGEYIYIGESVFSFQPTSPIVEHMSPVGNNNVPYPYSILADGTIYLLIEGVVLSPTLELNNYMTTPMNDPYSYYYKNHNITPDIRGQYRPENKYDPCFPYFHNIREFYIGRSQCTMSYSSNPMDDFVRFTTDEDGEYEEYEEYGAGVEIYVLVGEELTSPQLTKVVFTKESYAATIHSFGDQKGFSSFEKKVICPRL